MGGLVPPQLTRRLAVALLPLAVALPLALRRSRVLVGPAEDGMRRVLAPVPSATDLAVALVAAVGLTVLLARRDPSPRPWWAPLLGLLAAGAPLVPLLTGHASVLTLLQGPAVVLLAAALLGVTLARAHAAGAWRWRMPAPHGGVLLALAFGVFALVATRLPGPAGAQGDEPHYLLMAHSLWTDGDVDLADELRARDYGAFYAGTLSAHASPASPRGQVLPVHAPGLAALAAPVYAAGGATAVRLLMALMAAAAAAVAAVLVRESTGRPGAAWLAWAALVLTPPLPFYAVSIYPEVAAALATAVLLRAAQGTPSGSRLLAAVVASAALPWLHPKFLPLAAGGLLLVLLRPVSLPRRVAAGVVPVASTAALLAYFAAVYGRASLSAAYGTGFRDDVTLARAPWGLLALLADRQFGLLAVSPLWLLALPGAVLLLRLRPGDAVRAVLLAGLSVGVGASFSMWWGGSCPPARFVVPALPALALLAVLAMQRAPRAAAALTAVGATVVALAMDAPRAIHNRADAESGLLRHLAPQLDLDGFLPSFVAATDAPLAAKLLTAALALALVTTALLAWTRRAALVAVALTATTALAVAARGDAPLVEPRLATLRLLEAWDPGRSWSPRRSRGVDGLAVPVDLGPQPWVMRAGDLRASRRLDLPPGVYRLHVDAEARGDAGVRLLKLELVADEILLEKTYAGQGAPAPDVQVVLPVGVRRLQLTAASIQGEAVVRSAALRPVAIVPGPQREALEWPRVPLPDRYRVGELARVTALDRSEPRGDAFEARAGDRFVVDAPAGAAVVVRAEPRVRIRWAGREVEVDGEATLAAEGAVLGRLVAVPVTALGDGRLRFAPSR